jgi:DNA-binding GntR family transcriptional regulator
MVAAVALDRQDSAPLHAQLYDAILGLIDDELTPGERLPTEIELAKRFGVNRLTVRHALGELARTGHVVPRQGVGTFVATPPKTIEVDMTTGSWDALRDRFIAGSLNEERSFAETLLSADVVEAPRDVADYLGRGPLTWIETLSFVDGDLIAYSEHWTRTALSVEEVEALGRDGIGPGFMHTVVGCETYYTWRAFEAEAATRRAAEQLSILLGSPVLVRSGLNSDESGRPMLYVRRAVPAGRIRLLVRNQQPPS